MAFSQARTRGYGRLIAHVSDAPHSNMPFYQRNGFESTGVVEDGEQIISAVL